MSYRIERLNSEMRKVLSEIISRLKDPRITEMISITSVSVAKDLKTAKVYVEIFGGDDAGKNETYSALQRSAGYIRKELSRAFNELRTIPELTFLMDNSSAYSMQIDKILEEIRKNDPEGSNK